MVSQRRFSAQEVIDLLRLEPHPEEGGFFRETYRSVDRLTTDVFGGRDGAPRSVSTAIYYLLTPETFSEMHIVASDEVFHHYAGDAVEQLQLEPDGQGRIVVYGSNFAADQRPQGVVPAGVWQGARLRAGGEFGWALLGATVAPGFEYADYRSGVRSELVDQYPAYAAMIRDLT